MGRERYYLCKGERGEITADHGWKPMSGKAVWVITGEPLMFCNPWLLLQQT
jgi:hypothetical protein